MAFLNKLDLVVSFPSVGDLWHRHCDERLGSRLYGRLLDCKLQQHEVSTEVCSLICGLLMQALLPAGPDGIRGQGSYLIFGLNDPYPYRNFLAPV